METSKNSLSILGIILAIGLVVAALVVSVALYKIRGLDNTLSVTGSAKVAVTSDKVTWSTMITRPTRISTLQTGYAQIAADLVKVKKFLTESGIPESEITFGTVSFEENYNYQNPGTFAEKEYILRQSITINSLDVEKITAISRSIETIIAQGVIFQTTSLDYYYSKLPELRVSLLGDAVKDAQARADALAGATGEHVGSLKSASSGVVQVLSANSTDISDYGSYDTSQIEKEVMVTVKATFTLK